MFGYIFVWRATTKEIQRFHWKRSRLGIQMHCASGKRWRHGTVDNNNNSSRRKKTRSNRCRIAWNSWRGCAHAHTAIISNIRSEWCYLFVRRKYENVAHAHNKMLVNWKITISCSRISRTMRTTRYRRRRQRRRQQRIEWQDWINK